MPAFHRLEDLRRVAAAYAGRPALDGQQVEDLVAWLGTLTGQPPRDRIEMKRRQFIRAGAGAAAAAALGVRAQGGLAPSQDIRPLIEKITGGRAVERGGVDIEIPAIAENGNSVPTRLRIASPMTAEDHVSAVYVFAPRNPRPHVATFHLGPQSGRAEIATRIRLAGTQKLAVLAALSGGRFSLGESRCS
jgi:sulfur-oxidizing protein SoxY